MTRRKLSAARMAGLSLLGTIVVWPAAAQPREMTLVDLLAVPRVSDPRLSRDGSQLVYVRSDADWDENRRIGHIWRVNTDGSGAIQLTYGAGERAPRWSPDGTAIAFLAARGEDETTQLYLLPNDGGEAQAVTVHPTDVSDITWTHSGESLLFLAADAKSPDQQRRDEVKNDVYAFEENRKARHLWRVDVRTGETERLTRGDDSVIGYELSRDGTRLAYHRAPTPLFGDAERGEVWVSDADGGRPTRLTSNAVPEFGAALSPDNAQLLFVSASDARFEFYYNDNVFVVPAGGGAARLVTDRFPHEVVSATWAADSRSIYVVANTGVRSELFRLDAATGTAMQLTAGDHAVRAWHYSASADRHVVQFDTPIRAGDLWVLETRIGATPRRVTDVFGYLALDYALPRQERIAWTGADGVTVEGLVFYPIGYEPGMRYPLCVQTHGGPAASDKFGFQRASDYVPVLAALGYVVFKPNYRGSTGYGDPFLRDMVGGYFRQSHLDVMAGVDHLINLGLVDPDRMVKMGWSGGGHMTNKIITFTGRFKAASSGAGAANWVSMYAQSDVRTYRTPWFGGTPWQVDAPVDVYWDHSPLKDVANVTTPTLFLVGENDARVPMPQSVEMHRALKSLDVPTHLYVAPREGHGWRELRHQLFKMNVELDWFETYATGRVYEWETVPGDEPAGTTDGNGAAL